MANPIRPGVKRCPECGINWLLSDKAQRCNKCRCHPGWHGGQVVPMPATERIGEVPTSYQEAWAQWQREIGQAKEHYRQPKAKRGTRERIVVLSDIHSPWHEGAMLAQILESEKHADRCVILGDLDDAYAVSKFVQYEWMPFRDAWATTTLLLEQIASTFPRVDLVIGNHDVRLERQLLSRLTPDMVEAVRYLTGGILCPLTALAKHYPNVTVAKHKLHDGRTVDWFTTVGDAWLGHPEKFSKVPGSALRGVEEHLADRAMEWDVRGARLIVMGHTHQYAAIPWHADQLLVEAGCLCATQGYQTTARIGGRPQRRGYLTFEQVDGKTDLNSVKFTWLDVAERVA